MAILEPLAGGLFGNTSRLFEYLNTEHAIRHSTVTPYGISNCNEIERDRLQRKVRCFGCWLPNEQANPKESSVIYGVYRVRSYRSPLPERLLKVA